MLYLVSRKHTHTWTAGFALLLLASSAQPAQADPLILGQAASFGVLAGSTVTNTGPTVIFGNVGVSPGAAITGFPPGSIIGGSMHSNDLLAQQAQTDLTTAYNVIAGEAFLPAQNLSGQDLGGLTLTPGVYHFNTSAQLTGNLTLDAQGDPNARFDFQIGSTLTTASSSTVVLTNSASADSIFWQVGSAATLGTSSAFAGNILALTSITATTGATNVGGRLLARNGAVTLDTNTVGVNIVAGAPEPSASAFLAFLGVAAAFALFRRRIRQTKNLAN